MPDRVTMLLGKPPRPGTLLSEVAADLAAHGCVVTVRLPHEEPVRVADLAREALVVHRGLSAAASALLDDVDDAEIPLCTPRAADLALRDRRSWRAVLDRAGIPLPPSTTVATWPEVLDLAVAGEVVAKALTGPGRGARVATGTARTLPPAAPFAGPYLVEPRLPAESTDRKLYVVGGVVRGLLKPSTLQGPHTTAGTPFEPGPTLAGLARRAGAVLGAHLLGVDVIETPTGPVVVDVNGFPGFRGVEGAAALVGAHLRAHAAAG